MKRAVVVLAVLGGTTVPALVASVWLFGCCVLPFHRVLHGLIPLCHVSAAGQESHSRQPPSTAPRETRQTPMVLPPITHAVILSVRSARPVVFSALDYRSFITLGAIRCDRDVGLHTFLATFLI
jgi:hypothetical protein